MHKEMTCIICPKGCRLKVDSTDKGLAITGNQCPRGEIYAKEEINSPKRVLCCVVRTNNPDWPCIPVRTSSSIPKKIIPKLLDYLYSLKIDLPAECGDLLIEDFKGENVNVHFTRTLPPLTDK